MLKREAIKHFLPVIEKAKESFKNSGHKVSNHFEDILEMVPIGSGTECPLESVKLSRYACYLIVQNSDPSKEVVANGQTYFAVQTRIAEIKQMDEYARLNTKFTHYNVGAKVRQTIKDLGGTMPENLPVTENIKRVESKQKKILKDNKNET